MKTSTTFLAVILFLCIGFQPSMQAQTKIIAHKSHSGKAATFNIFSAHNFGLGPHHVTVVDTVFRVSDSTFVEVLRWEPNKHSWKNTITYTAENKNYYYERVYLGKSLEILEGEMPTTVFIGFEEEDEQQQPQQQGQNQNSNQIQNQQFRYFHHPNFQPKKQNK